MNRSALGLGVKVLRVALTGFGGEPGCGTPLVVMNAKLTYSRPVIEAQVEFNTWPVTGFSERLSMFSAERRINDILIAVRRTGAQLFGIGLRVAHRHAEPESGMEFKVKGFTGLGWIDWGGILGQREFISHLVA